MAVDPARTLEIASRAETELVPTGKLGVHRSRDAIYMRIRHIQARSKKGNKTGARGNNKRV